MLAGFILLLFFFLAMYIAYDCGKSAGWLEAWQEIDKERRERDNGRLH